MYQAKQQKIVATIEARYSSTRLPGKILLPLANKPALQRLVERLKNSQYVDEIVIATTVNPADQPIIDLADKLGVKYYRGSENDVLDRVLNAAKSVKADIIVEITSDCPLLNGAMADKAIAEFYSGDFDYSANIIKRSYPDGLDIQVFPVKILEQVANLTQDPIDRVHVSYYIYNHPETFKLHNWQAEGENFWPDLRLTLDEPKDYELLNIIFEKFAPNDENFDFTEAIKLLKNNPELLKINQDVKTKQASQG